jgi:branched-chain amino acid transport system substrate-binding protein
VKAARSDWVVLRSAGVMTPTALKEAAQVGFPCDRIAGNWGAGAEQDIVPAGEAAIGYSSLTATSVKEMGVEGLFPPITLSCCNHEGAGA